MYLNATPLLENWITVALFCLSAVESSEEVELESPELELELDPSELTVDVAELELESSELAADSSEFELDPSPSVEVVIGVVVAPIVVVGAFSGFALIESIALLTPSMASKFSTRRSFFSCKDKFESSPP